MKKNLSKDVIKKVADMEAGVDSIDNPDLLNAVEIQSGNLYEGVTDDAEVSDSAEYRMITKSDDTVSSQGS